MFESVLFASVPEAEQAISSLRQRYDPVARLGVPAHITLLYPFMPPSKITTSIVDRITRVLRHFDAFEFQLQRTVRLPETLYLEPEPSEPFVRLTNALAQEFPDYPPHGGRYSGVLPHLTVANRSASLATEAEAELAPILNQLGPIFAVCRAVDLFENSSGHWKPLHAFALRRSGLQAAPGTTSG